MITSVVYVSYDLNEDKPYANADNICYDKVTKIVANEDRTVTVYYNNGTFKTLYNVVEVEGTYESTK
jgi:hypothetical protein